MKWIKALCELNDKKIKCTEKWAKCKKYCQIVDARKIHIWPLSLWYPTTGTLYRRTTQVIGFRKSMEWKNTCLHLPIGYSRICWTSHFDKNIRLFVTQIKPLCLISIYFVMTATQKYDSSAPIVGLNLSSPCMSKLHMAEADALIQDGQNIPRRTKHAKLQKSWKFLSFLFVRRKRDLNKWGLNKRDMIEQKSRWKSEIQLRWKKIRICRCRVAFLTNSFQLTLCLRSKTDVQRA